MFFGSKVKGINLNVGGIVGGVLFGGAAFALFMVMGVFQYPFMAKIVIVGVVAGALGGHSLWGLVVGKAK